MSSAYFEDLFYKDDDDPSSIDTFSEPTNDGDPQGVYLFQELAEKLPHVSDVAIATLVAGEMNAQATIYAAKVQFYAAKAAARVQFMSRGLR